MSSSARLSSRERQRSISRSSRRNEGGSHLSKRAEHSRKAASPRASMDSRIPVTMSRTLRESAEFCSGFRPVLRWRAIFFSFETGSARARSSHVDRGGEHDNEAFDDELEFDRKAEDDDDVENQDEYQGAEQSPCDGANT